MSRAATHEYHAILRNRYRAMKTRIARGKVIDEFARTTGLERKYAIKLLSRNRRYRLQKGRGKTYGPDVEKSLVKLWKASRMMCSTYLKMAMGKKRLPDWEALNGRLPEDVRTTLLEVSPATIDRLLKPHRLVHRPNRTSGNNSLKSLVPCQPDRTLDASTPGQLCADTVALCGGDISGNFMWITTLTDILTQWTECRPAWNRGAHETRLSLVRALAAFPAIGIHSDSGPEFLNAHVHHFITQALPACAFTRSRPCHKNDNARVEQKNASIVRELPGEIRFDAFVLKEKLEQICAAWSLYNNLFRHCKRLLSREKRPDGKAFITRYDTPKTPYERLTSCNILSPDKAAHFEHLFQSTNMIVLRQHIEADLRHLYRRLLHTKPAASGLDGIPSPSNPPACKKRQQVSCN